jgi:GDP-4-dehydro-6-deoxy-D-mannose reductase
MRYLITGARGFIGNHLSRYLFENRQVVGLLDKYPFTNLEQNVGSVEFYIGDITNIDFIEKTILKFKPDIIYHLAAQSFPKVSWANPVLTMQVNIIGTLNLLEILRKKNLATKVIIFGSSSEYKQNRDGLPISETDPLEASSPYAVSKLASDNLSILYARNYNLNVVIVRPFFIIGKGKENDVCSDYAREIVKVEANKSNSVRVGNLEAVRDFLDIRDAIYALHTISEKGTSGEVYNICSGVGHSMGEILNIYSTLGTKKFSIENDLSLMRPLDEKIKIGNPKKIKELGWVQRFSFEESLLDILNYWRNI